MVATTQNSINTGTLTIPNNVTISDDPLTFVLSGSTNLTLPTSGTVATTSQLPSGAALTRTNDTNVTLTLGGSPTTSLLAATSITAGWSGTLSGTRGGTGVNNGSNTLTVNANSTIDQDVSTAGTPTFSDVTLYNGAPNSAGLRTGTTTGNLYYLLGYNPVGVGYSIFATMTAANPPTFSIAAPAANTLTIDGAIIGGINAAAASFTTLNATTYASGAFQGTVINSTYGGTGVNNGGRTLTISTNSSTITSSNQANTINLANNLTTSGNNALTLTTTGSTNVTLPTSGTLLASPVIQTYTPTIGNGTTNFTMTSQIGQYYQIGPLYFVVININWSNINSVSGTSIRISLPATITQNRATFSVGYAQGVTWPNTALSCIGDVTANFIRLTNNASGTMSDLGASAYSNGGGEVIITGWFS